MPSCAMKFCQNNSSRNKKHTFYQFPRDRKRFQNWAIRCGRSDLDYKRNYRVCEEHFKKEEIIRPILSSGRKRLSNTALPTMILKANKHKTFKSTNAIITYVPPFELEIQKSSYKSIEDEIEKISDHVTLFISPPHSESISFVKSRHGLDISNFQDKTIQLEMQHTNGKAATLSVMKSADYKMNLESYDEFRKLRQFYTKSDIGIKKEIIETLDDNSNINPILQDEINSVSQNQQVLVTDHMMQGFEGRNTNNTVSSPEMDIKSEIEVKEESFEYGSVLEEEFETASEENQNSNEISKHGDQSLDKAPEFDESLGNLIVFDGICVEDCNSMADADNRKRIGKEEPIVLADADNRKRIGKAEPIVLPTEIYQSNKFKCHVCHHETHSMKELTQHAKHHINYIPRVKAKVLNSSEWDYKAYRHSLMHKYKCSECNYQSILRDNLKKHLLIHSNLKLFKCSKCDYGSKRKHDLKRHFLTHRNKKV